MHVKKKTGGINRDIIKCSKYYKYTQPMQAKVKSQCKFSLAVSNMEL